MKDTSKTEDAVASATTRARARIGSRFANLFKLDHVRNEDEITFNDGRALQGKVVDFGPAILLMSQNGDRQMIDRADLSRVDIGKSGLPAPTPNLPDVDVLFIERLPRQQSYHGKVAYLNGAPVLQCPVTPPFPAEGSPVTFVAHVANKGGQPTGEIAWAWVYDNATVSEGSLPSLPPGAQTTVQLTQSWQNGEHTISFAARPINNAPEISLRNNIRSERTDALGFVICVSNESYPDYNASPNMTGSYSFEDWVQFHFNVMNALFEQSIYPGAINGCLQRVRVDKIARLPEQNFDAHCAEVKRDGHPDGMYFQGAWQFARWDQYPRRMANVDWGFIHEMGHQLGLVDEYHLNIPASFTHVKDNGALVNLSHVYSQSNSMMAAHGPVRFSPQATLGLNAQLNKQRGFFGDYQYALPLSNTLRVLNRAGQPVAGAALTVYQRMAGSFVTNDPIAIGQTNAAGEWRLPARPTPRTQTENGFILQDNPFGQIDPVGSNGLLLAKVQWQNWTEWHWLELPEFNVAALSGESSFTKEIDTMLPASGAIAAPTGFRAVFSDAKTLQLSFNPAPGGVAYRLYARYGNDGWDETPWKLIREGRETSIPNFKTDEPLTYLAVTAVAADGVESGLSQIAYAQHMRGVSRLTVLPDGSRLISDTHPHTGRIVRQNPDGACMDWDIHPLPDMWGRYFGLAVTSAGELLLANHEGGRIQLYDMSGAHIRSVGQPGSAPGQFNQPCGISLDEAGNAFVADTGNNRVQILDAALNPVAQIGGLNKPQGVAWLGNNRIAVADTDNKRVVVFGKQANEWRVLAIAPGFSAPVDVARCPDGRIAVADRDAGAVVILNQDGNTRLVSLPVNGAPHGVAAQPNGVVLAAIPWVGIIERQTWPPPDRC